MNPENIIYSLEALPQIARHIIKLIRDEHVHFITLEGSLGAGKTSLVRTILQEMGISGLIQSPTFSYVNMYTLPGGKKVYHFDLYRLSSLQQFYDAGFDEYMSDPDALIFIEWPGLIEQELFGIICKVMIEYKSADQREIILTIITQ